MHESTPLATRSQAILCPQCGGILPSQAIWRMVVCPFCGASVTRNPKVVLASRFRDAHLAAFENLPLGSEPIQVGGVVYRKLFQVGAGEHTEVFLAERISPMTERVILKIGPVGSPPPAFSSEVTAWNALQTINSDDSAYYSTRLPQVIRTGPSERTPGHERHVLVLRHAPGYWGSLDSVRSRYPDGIDARHIVWIWGRILEVLAFVHAHGWTHGNLRPEPSATSTSSMAIVPSNGVIRTGDPLCWLNLTRPSTLPQTQT